MIDVLEERFAALADDTDDSDWLDVRRRARRPRRRWTAVVVAAVAASFVAAALAAGTGWLFSQGDHRVTARTHVSLHGRAWIVDVTTRAGNRWTSLCVRLLRPDGSTATSGCGRAVSRLGPPFGAQRLDVDGGHIWVGVTVGFAHRIAITDAQGHVHSTRAIAAPRGTKTPFRYWVLALDTAARSITAYDDHGRAIRKKL